MGKAIVVPQSWLTRRQRMADAVHDVAASVANPKRVAWDERRRRMATAIRSERQAAGLSQQEMADGMLISASTIARAEQNWPAKRYKGDAGFWLVRAAAQAPDPAMRAMAQRILNAVFE